MKVYIVKPTQCEMLGIFTSKKRAIARGLEFMQENGYENVTIDERKLFIDIESEDTYEMVEIEAHYTK